MSIALVTGLVAGLVAVFSVASPQPAAQATPLETMAKVYDQSVHGDFSMFGNSVVDCIAGNGNTSAACANYANGNEYNDNLYFTYYKANAAMGLNSSTGTVQVPVGARIVKAQLYWGGSTGFLGNGAGGLTNGCVAGVTNTKPAGYAPNTTTPMMSINGGAISNVAVTNYNIDPATSLAANNGQFYTANNDVTALFAGLGTTGGTVSVTVGNIYTPQGLGCFGGWSLAVVWDFGSFQDSAASASRQVILYDGHVRISSNLASFPIISYQGFTASDPGIRLATTAWEGDRLIGGDQLRYSTGTAAPSTGLPNPLTGSTSNYFIAVANGQASEPAGGATASNGAIDVVQQQVNTPAGMTRFNLQPTSTQDSYLFNVAMFSVPVAAVDLTKTGPAGAPNQILAVGERPQFTITVRNTGSAVLTGIRVTDQLAPDCDSSSGRTTPTTLPTSLSPGASFSYTCFGPPVTASGVNYTNTASVVATSALGQMSSAGVTNVTVLKPNLAVDKTASVASVDGSGSVTYSYSVTNNNAANFNAEPLKNIAISDDKCAPVTKVSGDINNNAILEPGEAWIYSCTTSVPGPTEPNATAVTNKATVTAVTTRQLNPTTGQPANTTITATDTETVQVLRPNLNLTKTAGATTGPNANGIYTTSYQVQVVNTGTGTGTYGPITDTPAFDPHVVATGASWTGPVSGSVTGAGPWQVGAANTKIAANATHTYNLDVTWRYVTGMAAGACAGAGTGLFNRVAMDAEQGAAGDNTACVNAPAPPKPSLKLTKTAGAIRDVDGNGPDAGDTIDYTFSVQNTGDLNLTQITIDDAKLGLTNFTCAPGPVAPGASVSCSSTRTYTILQADADAGAVTNSATATATAAGGATLTSAPSSTSSLITGAPGLTMAKSANVPVDVNNNKVTDPGDTVTFTFQVVNTGNVTLAPVRIDDPTLGLTNWVCAASMAPGAVVRCQSPAYTITAQDQKAGAVVNTATANAVTPNQGTITTPASTATVKVASSTKIEILKRVALAPQNVNPATGGFVVSYDVIVRNSGDTPGSYGPLIDTPNPSGNLQVLRAEWTGQIDGTATGAGPYTLTPAATSIAGNTTHAYLVRVFYKYKNSQEPTACAGPGTGLYNSVSDVSEDDSLDDNAACAAAPAPPKPSITLVKSAGVPQDVDGSQSATVNDTIDYGFLVQNTGNVDVDAPTISDPMLASQGITVACAPAHLTPGQRSICTASKPYKITQDQIDAGAASNSAVASATPVAGSLADATSSTTTPLAAGAYIKLDKRVRTHLDDNSNGRVDLGDRLLFEFVVTNSGNVTLSNLSVNDPMLAGVTCPSTPVAPLASSTCVATAPYKVVAADVTAKEVVNTATVSGQPPTGAAVTMSDTERVPVLDPSVSMVKQVKTINDVNGNKRNDAGDTVIYQFVVTNTGNTALTGLQVSDPMVGSVTCPATSLAVGAGTTCTSATAYTITAADAAAKSFVNEATVSASPPEGTAVTSTANVTTQTQLASMTVTKSHRQPVDVNSDGRVSAGDSVVYEIKIVNTGNVDLASVTVQDARITDTGGTISCPRDTIAAGDTLTCTTSAYTIRLGAALAGELVNTAQVSATPTVGSAISGISADTLAVDRASLTLDKTHAAPLDVDADGRVSKGDEITYSFEVVNTGNVAVSNLVINDPLVSSITCPVTALDPGQRTTCTSSKYVISAQDADNGTVTNTAKATAKPVRGNTIEATDTDEQRVDRADYEFKKSIDRTVDKNNNGRLDAGDEIYYRFTVLNTGNVPIAYSNITDTLIPGPSPIVTCEAWSLPAGGTTVCRTLSAYTVTPADQSAGKVTNTATATAQPPTGTKVERSDTLVTPVERASITVVKSHAQPSDANNSGRVDAGDTVLYSFKVTNTGTVPVDAVSISDPKVSSITCPSGQVAPTEFVTCTAAAYTIGLTESRSGTVLNTATATVQPVKDDGSPLGTPVTGTGSDSITTTQAGLTLLKRVVSVTEPNSGANPNGRNDAGDTINYEFVVTNTGMVPLDTVSLSDAGATGLSCPATTLAAGVSMTCTATHQLTDAQARTGSYQNTATVSANAPTGQPLQATDSATVSTEVAQIELTKNWADGTDTNANGRRDATDTLTYNFVIKNTGTVALNEVKLSDPQLTGIVCLASSLAPNATTTCSADPYTIPVGEALSGTVKNVATVSALPARGSVVSDTKAVTIPVERAELQLDKEIASVNDANSNGFLEAGETITYRFVVRNTGNVKVSGIAITDPLTGGAVCSPTVLAAGDSVTCTASPYTIKSADVTAKQVTNSATVTGNPTTAGGAALGTPVSGSDTVTVRVDKASMSLDKIVQSVTDEGDLRTGVGDTINYRLQLTNTGSVPLANATITDDKVNGSLNCTPGNNVTLAVGATITCTGSHLITRQDAEAGGVVNTASATTTTAGVAPVTSSTTTKAIDVGLAVNKVIQANIDQNNNQRIDAGDVITYQVTVENLGTTKVSLLKVDDPLAAMTCTKTELPPWNDPGRFAVCTGVYTVTARDAQSGKLVNIATVSGQPVDNLGNPLGVRVVKETAPNTANTEDSSIGLVKEVVRVDDIDNNGRDSVGDVVRYAIVATNTGSTTLTNPVITDAAVTGLTCPTPAVTSLAPGAQLRCTASRTLVGTDGNSFTNAASVTAKPPSGKDVTATASVTTAIEMPAITLTKTLVTPVDKGADQMLNTGDVVSFTFSVKNTGNVPVSNIAVTDPSLGTITCDQSALAPNATRACTTTATHTISADEWNARSYVNTATATAQPQRGNTISDGDSVTIPLDHPEITVTKSHTTPVADTVNDGRTSTGDVVSYQFTVKNTGTMPVDTVAVTDLWADPLTEAPDSGRSIPVTCPPGDLAVGQSRVCTATYTITAADSAAGRVRNEATATAHPIGVPVNEKVEATATDVVETQHAEVSVAKTLKSRVDSGPGGVADSRVGENDVLTYAITLTNRGNTVLTGVALTDANATDVTCPDTTLNPGAVMECTAKHTITLAEAATGKVSNTASVSATPKTVTGAAAGAAISASGSVDVATEHATLSLNKVASQVKDTNNTNRQDAGDTVTYTFEVSLGGNVPFRNISITDPRLGLTNYHCASGPLTNTNVSCTFDYTLTADDFDNVSIVNNATVNAYPAIGNKLSATDDVTRTLSPTGGLSIIKSAGVVIDTNNNGKQDAGDTISYSFTVTNTGSARLTNVEVVDTELTPSKFVCAASLAAGASATCSSPNAYVLKQADVDAGKFVNTASAQGAPPSGTPLVVSSESAPATTTIAPVTKLRVEKSVQSVVDKGRPGPSADDEVTYSFKVINDSNVRLTNVQLNDPLLDPSVFACGAGILEPGEANARTCAGSAVYTVKQGDVDAGKVVNTVTATADLPPAVGGELDSAPTSNDLPLASTPSLRFVKSHAALGAVKAGDAVTFNFEVQNTSNVTIAGVAIADPRLGEQALQCQKAELAPGETVTCSAPPYLISQFQLNSGGYTNDATVSGRTPLGVAVSKDASDPVVLTRTPALQLEKRRVAVNDLNNNGSIDPFETISFEFALFNRGNVTLSAAKVTDPLVPEITCPPRDIQPGASVVCTAPDYVISAADVDAGKVINSASASAQPPAGDRVSANDSITTDIPARASLALEKHDDQPLDANSSGRQDAGDTITYWFYVTNTGNVTVHDVAVDDPRILGVPGAKITCNETTLASLQRTYCQATPYRLTQADIDNYSETDKKYQIVNTATARALDVKNAAVTSDQASTTSELNPQPGMTLVKSADNPIDVDQDGQVSPGDTVVYRFSILNTGATTLTLVRVEDAALAGVTCDVTVLGPGQTAKCVGDTYKLTQADIDSGTVRNTAMALGRPPDGRTVNMVHVKDSAIEAKPKVSLQKTSTGITDVNQNGFADAGDTLNYRLQVRNDGNVSLHGFALSDPMLGKVVCPQEPIPADATITCTAAPYVLQTSDFDRGKVLNQASVVASPPTGDAVGAEAQAETVLDAKPKVTLKVQASVPVDSNRNGLVGAGDRVTYTFTITNSGNTTLKQIVLDDPTLGIAAQACGKPELAPGETTQCTATITLRQAIVDAGGQLNTATVSALDVMDRPTSDSGQAVVRLEPSTGLSFSKRVVRGVEDTNKSGGPDAGDTVSFRFRVHNTTNVTVRDVRLDDAMLGLKNALCTDGPVAPDAEVDCELPEQAYTVKQADVDAGWVRNVATASVLKPDGSRSDSVTATAEARLLGVPAIDFDKDVEAVIDVNSDGRTTVGDQVTWRFTVRNIGNVSLTPVTIRDPRLGADDFACDSAELKPGGSQRCTRTSTITQADLDAGARLINTATVTGIPPANDQALPPAVVEDTAEVSLTRESAIRLAKQVVNDASGKPEIRDVDGDGRVSAGDVMRYQFTVTNTGTVSVASVRIDDQPLGLKGFVCGDTPLPADDPTTAKAENVRTCTSPEYVVTQDDIDAGVLRNTATVSGTAAGGVAVRADGTTATTIPQAGALTLAVDHRKPAGGDNIVDVDGDGRVSAGDEVVFTFTLTNNGAVSLNALAVNGSLFGVPVTNCTPTPLRPNATSTCTGSYRLTQDDLDRGTLVLDGVRATGTHPSGAGPVTVSSNPAADSLALPGVSSFTFAKTAVVVDTDQPGDGTPDVGDRVDYDFALTNTGTLTLRKPVIDDPMLGLSAAPCADAVAPGQTVRCGSALGASHVLTQNEVDAGALLNEATASASTPTGGAITRPGAAVVDLTTQPGLALRKTVDGGVVDVDRSGSPTPGDTVRFGFAVTNNSKVTLTNIRIRDALLGLTNLACGTGPLLPGASRECAAPSPYALTQADVDAGIVTNKATAVADAPRGAVVESPVAEVSQSIVNSHTLSVAKGAGQVKDVDNNGRTNAGDTVVWNFTVTNTGTATLRQVAVTDTRIGLTRMPCGDGPLAPKLVRTCQSPPYALTQADLDAGSVANTATASGQGVPAASGASGQGSATLAISGTATVTLEKSVAAVRDLDGDGRSTPGDEIVYQFTVTNTGSLTLFEVRVQDLKLDLKSFVCAQQLAPGASVTCKAPRGYVITLDDSRTGKVINNATVTAVGADKAPMVVKTNGTAGGTKSSTSSTTETTVTKGTPAKGSVLPQTGASAGLRPAMGAGVVLCVVGLLLLCAARGRRRLLV